MGIVTATYTIIKQGTASPTDLSYSESTITTPLRSHGISVTPTVNWNNDKGTFKVSPSTAEIFINEKTGVLSWTSDLASKTHKLTVTASNTLGIVTTTYTIIKQGTASPTDLSYSTNSITIQNGTTGTSVSPTVNWNNKVGEYKLSPTLPNISIDQSTGIINWMTGLTTGTYDLTVTASNSLGVATTSFTLISKAPEKPSDFYYSPALVSSLNQRAGSSNPPEINWNFDVGTFEIENNPDFNISIDENSGVIKWNIELKEGNYSLNIIAKNSLGTATGTFIINRIKENQFFPPSEFYYQPDQQIGNDLYSGKSSLPKIKWNNNKGDFSIENNPSEKITINKESGEIQWESGLVSGTYELIVVAQNALGSVSTTFTLNQKVGVLPPSNFFYQPNTLDVDFGESGNTSPPQIKWNNENGTFAINSASIEGIKIDPKTGVIQWDTLSLEESHTLTISASNSAGSTTTSFTLIVEKNEEEEEDENNNNLQPTNFKYTPDSFNIPFETSGESYPPKINWNNHVGVFKLVNPTEPEISIDPITGVVSWNTSLEEGEHRIEIQASNAFGSVDVEMLLIKEGPPIYKPSEFSYSPDTIESLVNNAGESVVPNINWNGQKGVFSFEEDPINGISIDPENGSIQWEETVEIDTYKLPISARNSKGKTTTNFTLIINGPQKELLKNYKLFQNYPNPSEEITYFTYRLSVSAKITITINTMDGRMISIPVLNQSKPAGVHTFKMNVSHLNAGVYILRLKSTNEGDKTRMFVVK